MDGVARKDNLDVKVVRVSNILGPFHDAHDYFDLFPLKNSGKNVQYELYLKKPLLKNFKVFDQVNWVNYRWHIDEGNINTAC